MSNKWYNLKGEVISETRDKVFLFGLMIDITIDKNQEINYDKTQATLAEVINSLPISFALWNSRDKLEMCNNKFREFYSLAPSITKFGSAKSEIFNLSNLSGGSEPAFMGTIFYVGLDLSNNLLSGIIPEQLGFLENLKSVDLSENQLTGLLPEGLYSLDSLQSLNLSNNLLSGEISIDIGNLTQLEGVTTYAHNSMTQYDALNLSNNFFTGLIPENICDLPLDWDDNYMEEYQGFDISNNQFCSRDFPDF